MFASFILEVAAFADGLTSTLTFYKLGIFIPDPDYIVVADVIFADKFTGGGVVKRAFERLESSYHIPVVELFELISFIRN